MTEIRTLPTDAGGNPLAWPDPTTPGGYVDAWNGLYVNRTDLLNEVPHWTATEATRVLAFGEPARSIDDDHDAPTLETLTYEHSDHGRYEVPADFAQSVAEEDGTVWTVDHLRELAEDMTDGDTDLSNVTSRMALVVILASLRYERELGSARNTGRWAPYEGPRV
jgi:hypothetical protein